MPYSANVLRRANGLLAQRRSAREAQNEELREKIYHQLPRVAELDRQLRRTMAELARAALGGGEDAARQVADIRRRNLELQNERADLLAGAGYPPDALDGKPLCAKCGDSGWVGGRMCDCLKILCTQEQMKELSQLLDLGEQSFDAFRLDYYSQELWPEWGCSPRENMEKVYKICRDYAQNFGRYYFDNLFLYGGTGLGKTFLSACIARTVSENGFSVVYDTANRVFRQFETVKFGGDEEETAQAKTETRRYLKCDLLILDDLGSEMTTAFVQSALYDLINTRLVGGKGTVISSNLTMDDARGRYSPQIASRLEGEYRALPFFGDDIRLLRKG